MQNLEARFDALIIQVDDAIFAAQNDRLVDFTAMNREITAVCAEAEQSVPDIARVIKPKMGALVTKLDELAIAIKHYQDRLMEKKAGAQ